MIDRACGWCSGVISRATYGGKQECRKSFEKRKFCCEACRRAHDNKKSRDYYAANKEKLRARKAELMRSYREADPAKHRRASREAKARLRDRIFEVYGSVCAMCGFGDKRALTLDHVLVNGAAERRELGERGVYRRAVEEFRPNEYRVLCMNCQFIERHKHDWINRPGLGAHGGC